ncbi:MAG TPA: hypothetical protein VFZ34_16155 [Blastocatellia bacterium]|nr:hypothetical protein [Blastocatellia bacterium]
MKTNGYLKFSLILGLVILAGARSAEAQVRNLFNNTNTAAVKNGGVINPQFLLNVPTNITQVVTYHWNFGQGARPGMISLRNNATGQTFTFAAIGTSGFNGAPNVNWVANVNVNVPAGVYTVFDSDRNTWSNNAQSAFQGFAIVRGAALPPPPAAPPRPVPPPQPVDRGANTFFAATPIIPAASMPMVAANLLAQTISDGIGGPDPNDWYKLTVVGPNGSQQPRGVNFVLTGAPGDVLLELYAYSQVRRDFPNPPYQAGQFIAGGVPPGATTKTISATLFPGDYAIRVARSGAATNYTLTISTPAR